MDGSNFPLRLGPVPGTRKKRGGPAYFRHPATTPEIRLHALVLLSEGEVSLGGPVAPQTCPTRGMTDYATSRGVENPNTRAARPGIADADTHGCGSDSPDSPART